MRKPSATTLSALLLILAGSPLFAANIERPVVAEGVSVISPEGVAPRLDPLGVAAPSIEGLAPQLGLEGLRKFDVPLAAPAAAQPQLALPVAVAPVAEQVAPVVAHSAFQQSISGIEAALGRNEAAQSGAQTEGDAARLDRLFVGGKWGRRDQGVPVPQAERASDGRAAPSAVFIVNDEGVQINGRAAVYYNEAKRLEKKYEGKIDMTESLDVMDDSYAAAYAKLMVLQHVASQRATSDHGVRLENTLQRVDGILEDHGKRVAVTTHQVFFHHAKNPQSEINEGIRRVGKYIDQIVPYFQPGGRADRQFGQLDEIVLGFDTRGYPEIKDFVKKKVAEAAKTSARPVRAVFLDDVAPVPNGKEPMRSALNKLIKRYKQNEGLSELMGGVIYSRYVGLLLELKTLEYYYEKGYAILQSGHEVFDENGEYITELDAVVRSPEGKTILVEAKSSRDKLPPQAVLDEKIEYKLRTYQKRRKNLEEDIGARMGQGPVHIDEVVFSFDVGRNAELKPFLESETPRLSRQYGYPVSFLFLQSGPGQPAQDGDGRNNDWPGGRGRKSRRARRGRR